MSEENTPVDQIIDDLDLFSADFFGQKSKDSEQASSKEDETDDEVDDASNEDTHDVDDADADDTADTEEDEEAEAEPEPKKRRNSAQERISELNAKFREEERRRVETERRLDDLIAELKNKTPESKPQTVAIDDGPTPDMLNEDGTEKYPLGEFDPQYIRDLTKYTFAQEKKADQERENQERQKQEVASMRTELENGWVEKLGPAKERYPDFTEKGEQLFGTFSTIDQNYGEYLTSVIMSMDHGPDVLYYLSNNLDEADKIVKAGAARATLALGRLEAKFVDAEAEKTLKRPRVSKAPEPPVRVNKGSAVSVAEVPDDTDDLDAFASKLFSKKR